MGMRQGFAVAEVFRPPLYDFSGSAPALRFVLGRPLTLTVLLSFQVNKWIQAIMLGAVVGGGGGGGGGGESCYKLAPQGEIVKIPIITSCYGN